MIEKEDLEFFKEGSNPNKFFEKKGYKTGSNLFKELVEEGFLDKTGENFILSEMGKNKLTEYAPEQYYAKLKTILKKVEELLKEKDDLEKKKINTSGSTRSDLNTFLHTLKRRKSFLIDEFNCISKELGYKEVKDLHSLEIEGSSILVYLEKKIPKIKSYRNNIELLRERINSLNFDDISEKNLLLSLKCIETGNFLGSFLISGRIIVFFVNKIRGETKEEKLGELEEKNAIKTKEEDKDRADRKMLNKLLEDYIPTKKYRDFASHHVTYFPDIEEAIRELGNAIEIAKRVKSL